MFEILAVIASIFLSANAIFQFRKTYVERKTLKDLSLVAWISCLLAVTCLGIRFAETGEWALFGMEIIHGTLDGITVYWIVRSSRK